MFFFRKRESFNLIRSNWFSLFSRIIYRDFEIGNGFLETVPLSLNCTTLLLNETIGGRGIFLISYVYTKFQTETLIKVQLLYLYIQPILRSLIQI